MRPRLRVAVWLSIAGALSFGALASAAPQARLDVGVHANGATGGQFDLGRKPKSLAAYKRYIVPLTR